MPESPNIWGQEGCLIDPATGLLCTACCQALIVLELDKPAGILCEHVTASGCGIINDSSRPATCHSYFCGDDFRFDRRSNLIETAFRQGKVSRQQRDDALKLNKINRKLFGS
jgi:hypothetical protein